LIRIEAIWLGTAPMDMRGEHHRVLVRVFQLRCQVFSLRTVIALSGLMAYVTLIEVMQSFTPYRFAI
jgi:hypothetical protein